MKIRSAFVSGVVLLGLQAILFFLLSSSMEEKVETEMKYLSSQIVQKKPHFETFYAIFSAPSEIEQRSVWRTEGLWSNRCLEHFSKYDISLVYRFVVGHEATYDVELLLEQKRYNDLIILDMHDGYRNLTCKLGTLMEWSTFTCPFTFDTMLRMDIDSFPNPFRVQEYARTLPSMTISGFVGDFVWGHVPVIRDVDSKWRDINYPLENYFPYPLGRRILSRTIRYITLAKSIGKVYCGTTRMRMRLWVPGSQAVR